MASQQEAADEGAGHEAEAIGRTQEDNEFLRLGAYHGCQPRQGDFGHGDAGDDEGGGPGLFPGVEHPQVQEHRGVGQEGEGGEAERPAQHCCGFDVEFAVGEEAFGNVGAENGEEDDDWDERDIGHL